MDQWDFWAFVIMAVATIIRLEMQLSGIRGHLATIQATLDSLKPPAH